MPSWVGVCFVLWIIFAVLFYAFFFSASRRRKNEHRKRGNRILHRIEEIESTLSVLEKADIVQLLLAELEVTDRIFGIQLDEIEHPILRTAIPPHLLNEYVYTLGQLKTFAVNLIADNTF